MQGTSNVQVVPLPLAALRLLLPQLLLAPLGGFCTTVLPGWLMHLLLARLLSLYRPFLQLLSHCPL